MYFLKLTHTKVYILIENNWYTNVHD